MSATLSEKALEQAAHCLRVLGHPHRLRMLQCILKEAHTVGELAEECGIASHVASEHLRLMERCGFLTRTRESRQVFYQVSESHIEKILNCIEERFAKRQERA